MQWLEKFQKKIISDSFRIVSDEVNFFIYDYHPENEWQEETINKASSKLVILICFVFYFVDYDDK